MTELLSRFQVVLQESSEESANISAELLLNQMGEEAARVLRRCAIPHRFDLSLLAVLAPELSPDEAQALYEEISQLAFVCPTDDEGLALHDQVRQHLFLSWLEDSRREELSAINRRLVAHFTLLLEGTTGECQEWLEARRMFHLVGTDQELGIAEFERLFRVRHGALRLAACDTLRALVHEYDRILTRLNALRIDYQEAKLHAERRQWARAEALFRRVLSSGEEAPSALRFQALFRLGLLFAEQQAWSRATQSLTQALELARAEPEINLPVHRVLYEMARICRASGSPGDAALLLEECIKWAELLNAGCDLALAHNALGEVHHQLGQHHQALAEYRKCLSVLEDCHELEDKLLCARAYNNLGVTCADLEAWFESACYFKSSLILARQAGDLLGQATALNNLMQLKQALCHDSQEPRPCLLLGLDEE